MKNLHKKKDLDSILKICASKLDQEQYNKLCRIIWALLNGANFEIKETWSTDFLKECEDVWFQNKNLRKLSLNNCNNIIDLNKEKKKRLEKKIRELQKDMDGPEFNIEDFDLDDEF